MGVMEPNSEFLAGSFIIIVIATVIALMIFLVRWARRRSTGAIAVGALMSVFAPDPTLEQNIKLVEEAREVQNEEDEEEEPR